MGFIAPLFLGETMKEDNKILRSCLVSRLPMIGVTTREVLYLEDILAEVVGTPIYNLPDLLNIQEYTVYFCLGSYDGDNSITVMYNALREVGSSLIVINPQEELSCIRSAGELESTEKQIREVLARLSVEDPNTLFSVCRSMTLQEIEELVLLCMADHGAVTPSLLSKVHQQFAPKTQGLRPVTFTGRYYAPVTTLADWIISEAPFFFEDKYKDLAPRGLLLTGQAGTGKTQGTKYIAEQLNVPCYMLSIGDLLSKWTGENEQRLHRALTTAEHLAPCVLLLDEVEKLFKNNSDDGGVITRLLGMLLWWLQEHSSKVLTVMTTNDQGALPPELIRVGRIDKIIELQAMTKREAKAFSKELITRVYIARCTRDQLKELRSTIDTYFIKYTDPLITGAEVVGVVKHAYKQTVITSLAK